MSDDLQRLEEWAEPILRKLSAGQRRQLTRDIAFMLRRSQRDRIKAQLNPDGSPFEPRKPQLRRQRGAIRRKAMFTKLRTAKYLKAKGNADAATVGFSGRVAQIARVHQLGLRARVEKGGPTHDYPRRALLGFGADRDAIADRILRHIAEP